MTFIASPRVRRRWILVSCLIGLGCCVLYCWFAVKTNGTIAHLWSHSHPVERGTEIIKGIALLLVLLTNGYVAGLAICFALELTDRQYAPGGTVNDAVSDLLSGLVQPVITAQVAFLIIAKLIAAPIGPMFSLTPLPNAFALVALGCAPSLFAFAVCVAVLSKKYPKLGIRLLPIKL